MVAAPRGFTIIELLVVVVVIGILAGVIMAAFGTARERSQTSKINSDLATLQRAIMSARVAVGDQITQGVTTSFSTAGACMTLASQTDLANKTDAATCWTAYNNALNAISNASNANVRNLVDPWGRPYFIDENEREGGAACGGRDNIGVFARPHVSGGWGSITNVKQIPYITPGC